MRTIFVCLFAISLSAGAAQAGLISYTNRATWEAAAGPLSGTENFNSFGADAQFRTSTVAVNNAVIAGTTGANGDVTNIIDASDYAFSGFYNFDSTSYLLGDLVDGQSITFTFSQAVTAWGADFKGIADGGRPTRIDVFNTNSDLIGSIALASDGSIAELQFYGFTTTGGDTVGSIMFVNPGNANDVFGIDNTGFVTSTVAVPVPSSLVLMSIALATCMGAGALKKFRNRLCSIDKRNVTILA